MPVESYMHIHINQLCTEAAPISMCSMIPVWKTDLSPSRWHLLPTSWVLHRGKGKQG